MKGTSVASICHSFFNPDVKQPYGLDHALVTYDERRQFLCSYTNVIGLIVPPELTANGCRVFLYSAGDGLTTVSRKHLRIANELCPIPPDYRVEVPIQYDDFVSNVPSYLEILKQRVFKLLENSETPDRARTECLRAIDLLGWTAK